MRRLSLAPLTLEPVSGEAHIEAAASAGFDAVALRLRSPGGIVSTPADPALPRAISQLKTSLRNSGLSLLHVTGLWIQPGVRLDEFLPVLDAAAELGAQHVLTVISDPDEGRALSGFTELCEQAARRRLRLAIEFLPYVALCSLPDTAKFIAAANQPNGGILIDALHLSRSGGSPANLAAVDRSRIFMAQLCDAPRQPPPPDQLRVEARTRRLYPGDGELWLHELLMRCRQT
jgi:sugar phosphate isomerase/epimerase